MKACSVICRKATVALPDANYLSPWCQSPLSEHKIGIFVRFSSKVVPMVVRRGSMLVVSSRWRPLMMTLAHSPAYRRPGQQYLCHGAPASNKPHPAEKRSGLASNLAHLDRIC